MTQAPIVASSRRSQPLHVLRLYVRVADSHSEVQKELHRSGTGPRDWRGAATAAAPALSRSAAAYRADEGRPWTGSSPSTSASAVPTPGDKEGDAIQVRGRSYLRVPSLRPETGYRSIDRMSWEVSRESSGWHATSEIAFRTSAALIVRNPRFV